MKAQELMIGDLVQNTNGNKGKVIGFRYFPEEGINEIVVSYSENSTCWSDENMIKPIPLTAEILEKNGFWYDDSPFICSWKKDGFYIYENDGVHRTLGIGIKTSASMQYVHQLQHALRLCGLTELADNVKI